MFGKPTKDWRRLQMIFIRTIVNEVLKGQQKTEMLGEKAGERKSQKSALQQPTEE